MKTIRWYSIFLAGLAAGGGLGAGVAASAAVGDLIYVQTESATLSVAQAGDLADAFKAIGVWSGAKQDMIACSVYRDPSSATGFRADCRGLKSAAPGDLPVTDQGVQVVGIVE